MSQLFGGVLKTYTFYTTPTSLKSLKASSVFLPPHSILLGYLHLVVAQVSLTACFPVVHDRGGELR